MQMRQHLAPSMLAGVPFELAYKAAWRKVVWPHDTEHRRGWKRALTETKWAWLSAYEQHHGDPIENTMTGLELVA